MSKLLTLANVLRLLVTLPLSLSLVTPAIGSPQDANQSITIDADRAQLDRDASSSIYSGNVRMVQGNLKLEGDQITILHDARGQPLSATIIGSPARYEQQVTADEPPVRGQALRMEYSANSDMLTLSGDARIERGSDIVTGETVTYDRGRNKILASGAQKNRVHITFTPNQPATSTDAPATSAKLPGEQPK